MMLEPDDNHLIVPPKYNLQSIDSWMDSYCNHQNNKYCGPLINVRRDWSISPLSLTEQSHIIQVEYNDIIYLISECPKWILFTRKKVS